MRNWFRDWWLELSAILFTLWLIGGLFLLCWHATHQPPKDYTTCQFHNSQMVLSKVSGEMGQIIRVRKRNDQCSYSVRFGVNAVDWMMEYELNPLEEQYHPFESSE